MPRKRSNKRVPRGHARRLFGEFVDTLATPSRNYFYFEILPYFNRVIDIFMIIIIILKKRKYLFTQIKSLRIPQKSRGLKRIITISIMQMYTTRYTGGRQPYGRMSNSKQLVHPGELVNKAKQSKAKQSRRAN